MQEKDNELYFMIQCLYDAILQVMNTSTIHYYCLYFSCLIFLNFLLFISLSRPTNLWPKLTNFEPEPANFEPETAKFEQEPAKLITKPTSFVQEPASEMYKSASINFTQNSPADPVLPVPPPPHTAPYPRR